MIHVHSVWYTGFVRKAESMEGKAIGKGEGKLHAHTCYFIDFTDEKFIPNRIYIRK